MGACFKYVPPSRTGRGHSESGWILIGHNQRPLHMEAQGYPYLSDLGHEALYYQSTVFGVLGV